MEAALAPKKGIIKQLYPYYLSHIQGILDAFYEKYCGDFFEAAEEKAEEHRLEWSMIHKEYEELLEGSVSNFLRDCGYTREEWAAEVTRTHDRPDNKQIFSIIAAQHDYEKFVTMMKDEARDRVKNQRLRRAMDGLEAKQQMSPSRRRRGEGKMTDADPGDDKGYEGKTRRRGK